MQTRIEVLDQVVEGEKIAPYPGKIRAQVNFPEPQMTKQVQCFHRLTGYIKKFIAEYTKITKEDGHPLHL